MWSDCLNQDVDQPQQQSKDERGEPENNALHLKSSVDSRPFAEKKYACGSGVLKKVGHRRDVNQGEKRRHRQDHVVHRESFPLCTDSITCASRRIGGLKSSPHRFTNPHANPIPDRGFRAADCRALKRRQPKPDMERTRPALGCATPVAFPRPGQDRYSSVSLLISSDPQPSGLRHLGYSARKCLWMGTLEPPARLGACRRAVGAASWPFTGGPGVGIGRASPWNRAT